MFCQSVFNMAPNTQELEAYLSFRYAEISLQKLELLFKMRKITQSKTKIEKAFFYADAAVAEWMLNADILKK